MVLNPQPNPSNNPTNPNNSTTTNNPQPTNTNTTTTTTTTTNAAGSGNFNFTFESATATAAATSATTAIVQSSNINNTSTTTVENNDLFKNLSLNYNFSTATQFGLDNGNNVVGVNVIDTDIEDGVLVDATGSGNAFDSEETQSNHSGNSNARLNNPNDSDGDIGIGNKHRKNKVGDASEEEENINNEQGGVGMVTGDSESENEKDYDTIIDTELELNKLSLQGSSMVAPANINNENQTGGNGNQGNNSTTNNNGDDNKDKPTEPKIESYVWEIPNFMEMRDSIGEIEIESSLFELFGAKWKLLMYPNGNHNKRIDNYSNYLAAYVYLCSPSMVPTRYDYRFVIEHAKDKDFDNKNQSYHKFWSNDDNRGFNPLMGVEDLQDYIHTDKQNSLRFRIDVWQGTDKDDKSMFNYRMYDSKQNTGYLGILNQGATCYMNSMLQTLFHLPNFRSIVYSINTTNETNANSSVALALQRVFYQLQTNPNPVSTKQLTKAFGWNSMDSFVQHDVQEFSRVLIDNLQEKIKKQFSAANSKSDTAGGNDKSNDNKSNQNNQNTVVIPNEINIAALFEGKLENYVECIHVPYKSSRIEPYLDLSMNVKGCGSLYKSFDEYISVETLEGSNQYRAENHGKQDAKKGSRFKSFPPVLQLQLKRFEFDFVKEQNIKLNERFEFPDILDLSKYLYQGENPNPTDNNNTATTATIAADNNATVTSTDENKDTNENKENKDEKENIVSITTSSAKPNPLALYALHSVLVHAGGVSGGHYYNYVRPFKKRPVDKMQSGISAFDFYTQLSDWYKFDDETVTRVKSSEAIQGNYGGDKGFAGRMSSASAYMLVYVNSQVLDAYVQQQLDLTTQALPAGEKPNPHLKSIIDVPFPLSLTDRFAKEVDEQKQQQAERAKAHLFTDINVLSDINYAELTQQKDVQCGLELTNSVLQSGAKSVVYHCTTNSIKVERTSTLPLNSQLIASAANINPENQQYWKITTRDNQTTRPNHYFNDLNAPIQYNLPLTVFVRSTVNDLDAELSAINQAAGLNITYNQVSNNNTNEPQGDRVLILLKYFDVQLQKLVYLGSTIFYKNTTIPIVKQYVKMLLKKKGLTDMEKLKAIYQQAKQWESQNKTNATTTTTTDEDNKNGENAIANPTEDVDNLFNGDNDYNLISWEEEKVTTNRITPVTDNQTIIDTRCINGDIIVFQLNYNRTLINYFTYLHTLRYEKYLQSIINSINKQKESLDKAKSSPSTKDNSPNKDKEPNPNNNESEFPVCIDFYSIIPDFLRYLLHRKSIEFRSVPSNDNKTPNISFTLELQGATTTYPIIRQQLSMMTGSDINRLQLYKYHSFNKTIDHPVDKFITNPKQLNSLTINDMIEFTEPILYYNTLQFSLQQLQTNYYLKVHYVEKNLNESYIQLLVPKTANFAQLHICVLTEMNKNNAATSTTEYNVNNLPDCRYIFAYQDYPHQKWAEFEPNNSIQGWRNQLYNNHVDLPLLIEIKSDSELQAHEKYETEFKAWQLLKNEIKSKNDANQQTNTNNQENNINNANTNVNDNKDGAENDNKENKNNDPNPNTDNDNKNIDPTATNTNTNDEVTAIERVPPSPIQPIVHYIFRFIPKNGSLNHYSVYGVPFSMILYPNEPMQQFIPRLFQRLNVDVNNQDINNQKRVKNLQFVKLTPMQYYNINLFPQPNSNPQPNNAAIQASIQRENIKLRNMGMQMDSDDEAEIINQNINNLNPIAICNMRDFVGLALYDPAHVKTYQQITGQQLIRSGNGNPFGNDMFKFNKQEAIKIYNNN